ncbi:uncharacterized protein LOC586335 [Strongylocentrotus purpuratus]|uniref:Endonuclease/exonuclease/phosphatase domain-containing protein n=1 Tax=Strongylocentrotus purpuratus TaxID=7668 RepID=A0A7M7HPJ4_STRPU|nr:uncharacterized protein LOC586335 [Strongylocentrotus purpuratus]|eukprot:XP_011674653.1 PREDICTED: uncharacterized protein LOC586335 [Strongylocentrotus purpuratus]
MSLTELERSLSRLSPTHSVVIGGDFNLPGWDWRNQQVGNCRYPNLHRRLGSLLDDHGLTQVVTEPTRYQNTLDLLLVSNPTVVNEVTVVPGVSDHDCPLVKLNVRPTRRLQMRRKVLLYSKAQWEKFGESIEAVRDEIEAKVTYASVNELWLIFKTGIEKGINDFIPQKLTPHKANLPWVTNGIRRLIKKRDRLSNECRHLRKREGLIPYVLEERLRDLKRTLQFALRKAYWNYVESIFTVEDDDEGPGKYNCMKRFWQFIKNNRNDSAGIAELKSDGVLFSEPAEKADALNRQFKKVFTQEIPIPPHLLPDTSEHESMPDIVITLKGIEMMLKKLKPHKAPGPDGITPRILKQLSRVIAPILRIIYRLSYDTGEIPDDWHKGNVVPVYKKGDRTDPSNYRPISLTCICCKMMEHILASSIMRHGDEKDILHPSNMGSDLRDPASNNY